MYLIDFVSRLGMEHNLSHMSIYTESAYIYALLEVSENSLIDL